MLPYFNDLPRDRAVINGTERNTTPFLRFMNKSSLPQYRSTKSVPEVGTVEQKVSISVGGLPVHPDVEASVLLYVHGTVQKGQTVGTDIFTGELEKLQLPVAGGCSLVRAQGSALNLHI